MAISVPQFPYARYNQDVWNSHNTDALAEYFAADARVHSMTPGTVAGAGLDYLKARARSLFDAFPDLNLTVEDVVQQADRVAARVTLEGTHRAEFGGIPPTGK